MKLKLKIAVLACAVWLTVCFLLYTEDGAAAAQRHPPSGVAAPQVANGFVPPALPLRRDTPIGGHSRAKSILNQAGPEQGCLHDMKLLCHIQSRLSEYFHDKLQATTTPSCGYKQCG